MMLGFIIPMLLVMEGNLQSYWMAATYLMIPCFIFFILGIPGIREDKVMIERALTTVQGREPFFKTLKSAIKRKNFIVLAFTSIALQVSGACVMASIYYFIKFILKLPLESQADVLFIVVWFIAGLVSIPFWLKILPKFGK